MFCPNVFTACKKTATEKITAGPRILKTAFTNASSKESDTEPRAERLELIDIVEEKDSVLGPGVSVRIPDKKLTLYFSIFVFLNSETPRPLQIEINTAISIGVGNITGQVAGHVRRQY